MFLSDNSTGTKKKGLAAYSAVRGRHLLHEGVVYFISLPILEEATDNFSKRVGKESFGSVYYGRMKDGKEVAVKITADPSSRLNIQFATEVALLSRIHHRNLVPLIGYYEKADRRLLVYEYMHNGTLGDHLHSISLPLKFGFTLCQ
ncbi:hypothetical protein F2Q70_00042527 [Brassica cretica]|uniref:Protein kinase domain-containing protein n=1 Tax=Brassica cretica TaxID=69181 RepID=A0A8S9KG20_BRACR|nr:hypothetical protein F2Q70_00042527 [Brassica cretica]